MLIGEYISKTDCQSFYEIIRKLSSFEDIIETSIDSMIRSPNNRKEVEESLFARDKMSENVGNLSEFFAECVKTHIQKNVQKNSEILSIFVYLMIQCGKVREIKPQFDQWNFEYWDLFVASSSYIEYTQHLYECYELELSFKESENESNLIDSITFFDRLKDQVSSSTS